MMRIVAVVFVVFLVSGCGNNRHSYLAWPAKLVSLNDFSPEQEELVLSIINEFNDRSGKNLIIMDDAEAESIIHIQLFTHNQGLF